MREQNMFDNHFFEWWDSKDQEYRLRTKPKNVAKDYLTEVIKYVHFIASDDLRKELIEKINDVLDSVQNVK